MVIPPLHYVAENNKIEIVKLLLQEGAFFDMKNKEGKALFELINNESTNLLKEINQLFNDVQGVTPELIIKQLHSMQNINTIINSRDSSGNTMLHYAVQSSYFDIVECLLQQGAFFDIKNKAKNTPEEYAYGKIKSLLSSINKMFEDVSNIYNTNQQIDIDIEIIKNVRNSEGIIPFPYYN